MKRYYRQTPSSKGLKSIENKTLTKYGSDFYSTCTGLIAGESIMGAIVCLFILI